MGGLECAEINQRKHFDNTTQTIMAARRAPGFPAGVKGGVGGGVTVIF